MFLDPLPAFGRSVDRRGPTKPSAMEILAVRPDQLPHFGKCRRPKRDCPSSAKISYSTFTGCYRLGNIDAIQLRRQETDALRFGRHWYGGPNVISRAFAYAKFFSRSHDAVIRAYYVTLSEGAFAGSAEVTIGKEATEWLPDTIQVV